MWNAVIGLTLFAVIVLVLLIQSEIELRRNKR